jgi:hypothetical protein
MEEKMQQLTKQCTQLRQKKQTLEDELVELNKLTRQGTTTFRSGKRKLG